MVKKFHNLVLIANFALFAQLDNLINIRLFQLVDECQSAGGTGGVGNVRKTELGTEYIL